MDKIQKILGNFKKIYLLKFGKNSGRVPGNFYEMNLGRYFQFLVKIQEFK